MNTEIRKKENAKVTYCNKFFHEALLFQINELNTLFPKTLMLDYKCYLFIKFTWREISEEWTVKPLLKSIQKHNKKHPLKQLKRES